jgi:hypothetical protein
MEYPSNSINGKKSAPAPAEAPKVQPIVTATTRKPSMGKRLKQVFIGADANSVWAYVAYDVLIPAIKDTIMDAGAMALEKTLFGDGRGSSRSRTRGVGSGATGHIDYGGFSKTKNDRYGSGGSRQMSQGARSSLNFDEIILDTRTEAESVIEHLAMIIDQYQVATVRDLYDLCNVTNNDWPVTKWGWSTMQGSSVTRLPRGGYLLNLPKPEELGA